MTFSLFFVMPADFKRASKMPHHRPCRSFASTLKTAYIEHRKQNRAFAVFQQQPGHPPMAYFDHHPNQFRLFFSLLALALFLLASVAVYRVAGTPTDENLFTNPPSNLYVTRSVP